MFLKMCFTLAALTLCAATSAGARAALFQASSQSATQSAPSLERQVVTYQGHRLSAKGFDLMEFKAGRVRLHPAAGFALVPVQGSNTKGGKLWVSFRGQRLGTVAYLRAGGGYRLLVSERRRNLFRF